MKKGSFKRKIANFEEYDKPYLQTDALNYAKTHNLKDYGIDELNLYEDKGVN